MIALDSNVVLRYLLGDDHDQTRSVRALLEDAAERSEEALISDPVLCEIDWVLRFSYKLDRRARCRMIEGLLADAAFRFESRERVGAALAATSAGRADLSDHLIGLRDRELGATTTYTFDRALRRDPRFTLL